MNHSKASWRIQSQRKINLSLGSWSTELFRWNAKNKKDLEASKNIYHMYHNTPDNITSGKYVIKSSRFNSGTPEECLTQEGLSRTNECMERVRKDDAKTEFLC